MKNINRNSNIFIQENAFESVVCKMVAILCQHQCGIPGELGHCHDCWGPGLLSYQFIDNQSLITRLMGTTWGPTGADRIQVGPMLAPRILLSGMCWPFSYKWILLCYEKRFWQPLPTQCGDMIEKKNQMCFMFRQQNQNRKGWSFFLQWCLYIKTNMSSFWLNFHHWLQSACQNVNFRWGQWWKFNQNEVVSISVYV